MTAAVLKIFRLDPIVSEKEFGLLKPRPVSTKIIYERSQIRPLFFYFFVAHVISPFALNLVSTLPLFGGPDV
jgi:hypothetical protein